MWVDRVQLIAETDRVLRYQSGKRHRRWTAGDTARTLKMPASTVSMCVQLEQGFVSYPQLRHQRSQRAAYDMLQQLERAARN